jgi:hypothetical protein
MVFDSSVVLRSDTSADSDVLTESLIDEVDEFGPKSIR